MINTHTSEAVADLRSFYGVSLWSVQMRELWHLVVMLVKDPSSRLHAAMAGWEFPVSREWLVFADLVDVQLAAKSKKRPKPYPRPFKAEGQSVVGKSSTHRTPAELSALLSAMED